MTERVDESRDKNEARAARAWLNFTLSEMDASQCEVVVRGGFATLRLPSRVLLALAGATK